jgi:DNA mismatch repair ATPase MutS
MGFNKYLKLDLAAINALMIFPKAGIDSRFAASEKQSHKTLVEYLDRCKTAMG